MTIPFWLTLAMGISITAAFMISWCILWSAVRDPRVKTITIKWWFIIKNVLFITYWCWIFFG